MTLQSRDLERIRCLATVSGRQCKKLTQPGNIFCTLHLGCKKPMDDQEWKRIATYHEQTAK
ncbi:MAG: hypothetical protein WC942_12105 [Clostridia bacterium]|jgi:hypothetical protein